MTKNIIISEKWILFILKKQLQSKLFTNDLNNIGLDGIRADLDFSNLIFEYFEINEDEDNVEWYFNHLDALVKDLKYNQSLDKATTSLYKMLKKSGKA